jgi:serine protease inhibitor
LRGLSSLEKDTKYVMADVSVPRLHVGFRDENVGELLQPLGMTRAFSDSAEFQGIAPPPLWIDKVVHQAALDLNEKGVEAAGGTAVIMVGAAPPSGHMSIMIDRPFVVVLSDRASGVALFMAVVNDPR